MLRTQYPSKRSVDVLARTAATAFLLLVCLASPAPSQTDAQLSDKDSVGIGFSPVVESTWEFGLTVNSTGNTRDVSLSVPIPRNWPEQEVELLSEQRTDYVSQFKTHSPTDESRQLIFKVNQVNPQNPGTGYMRFKIKKRSITAPEDTSIFVVPAKPPREVKRFLKPSPFIESKHRRIREIARSLQDESLSGWEQTEKIYRWVRENVKYKFDTKIHSCLDALDSKTGDCEELSSLFIAICRAQKIPARAVWIPGHTYPEFYLQDQDGNGHWFPCQAAGSYEFGAMTETKPILQKGDRFKIPGERKEVRYLRPTLIAKQPSGQISFEWIMRLAADSQNSETNQQSSAPSGQ